MGTLSTLATRARYHVRDYGENQFTDAEVLSYVNGTLDDIYRILVAVESNLVYSHGTISAVDGTTEYDAPATNDGYLVDGVWVDGEDIPLIQVSETDRAGLGYEDATDEGQPLYYYITESAKVGFIPTPDASYTVHAYYWKPQTALTDIDTDDVPDWARFFKGYIERKLVVDLLERQERDNSRHALQAQMAWNAAMNMVYNYGLKKRRQVSDFFSVEGI